MAPAAPCTTNAPTTNVATPLAVQPPQPPAQDQLLFDVHAGAASPVAGVQAPAHAVHGTPKTCSVHSVGSKRLCSPLCTLDDVPSWPEQQREMQRRRLRRIETPCTAPGGGTAEGRCGAEGRRNPKHNKCEQHRACEIDCTVTTGGAVLHRSSTMRQTLRAALLMRILARTHSIRALWTMTTPHRPLPPLDGMHNILHLFL